MFCGKNHGHGDETAFGENYVRFVFFDELASLRIAFQHADRIREVFQIKAGDTIMVLGDEAQGIALVKADDMIDFVQQALKMANQKDKN